MSGGCVYTAIARWNRTASDLGRWPRTGGRPIVGAAIFAIVSNGQFSGGNHVVAVRGGRRRIAVLPAKARQDAGDDVADRGGPRLRFDGRRRKLETALAAE